MLAEFSLEFWREAEADFHSHAAGFPDACIRFLFVFGKHFFSFVQHTYDVLKCSFSLDKSVFSPVDVYHCFFFKLVIFKYSFEFIRYRGVSKLKMSGKKGVCCDGQA